MRAKIWVTAIILALIGLTVGVLMPGFGDKAVGRSVADYIFYVEGGVCYAQNGSTGVADYSGADHASVIQSALDAISRGVYDFKSCDFLIGPALQPSNFQTWRFASGAEFKPTGDNSILDIDGVEQLSFEGVLRCIDPATDVDGFLSEDGGVFTDETVEATEDTANDMTLLPAIPLQVNDACYIGKAEQFNCVKLEIGTGAVGDYNVIWEYWDSVAVDWQEITDFRDDSRDLTANAFSKTGTAYLFFKTVPANWGLKTLEGKNLYWIRCRVTAETTYTTLPKGNQAWVYKTMTKPAIVVDNLEFSVWENIFIRHYFKGIEFNGTLGTRENTFDDIYYHVRDEGISLETQCHDNHFTQIFGKGVSPYAYGHATGNGLRIATTGTQGGNTFPSIELIDMGKGINMPGATEVWFGSVLVDNARDEGILALGDCERIFFNTVWVSSGGDGFVIAGEALNIQDTGIVVNQLFAWLNANHGLWIKEYVKRARFGSIVVTRNDKGLEIDGPTVEDIHIGKLTSWDNTTIGVDTAGAMSDVYCDNAVITDTCDLTGFTRVRGNLPGTGLLQNKGTATVADGDTDVTVAHGLGKTPAASGIQVTPTNNLGDAAQFWISDVGAANFKINVNIDPGVTTATFVWSAGI